MALARKTADSETKQTKRVRANGEGAIYKRPDGRWTARLTLLNGRRKDYDGKTREEVNGKLTRALVDQQKGLPIVSERQTVAQFFASWLESVEPSLRTRTYVTYEGLIRLHAEPSIGRIVLSSDASAPAGPTPNASMPDSARKASATSTQ